MCKAKKNILPQAFLSRRQGCLLAVCGISAFLVELSISITVNVKRGELYV